MAVTTDDGTTWQGCPAPAFTGTHGFTSESVNAQYESSRLKGKLAIAFQNSETDMTPGEPNGVWFYQSP